MENVASPSGLFSLKWKGYSGHLTKGICSLLDDEDLADVTLACEGNYIRAHKLLLSLCSPYFKKLFQLHSVEKSNTIVILNHVRFTDLQNVLHFIYTGQVNVNQADLNSFLQTGELLQIEGLASCSEGGDDTSDSGSKEPSGGVSNANSGSSGSEKLKRGVSSSQNANRLPEKRFKTRLAARKGSPITLRSSSTDKQDQPLIQIRPQTELVEDIDPLDDSNMSSYSDQKLTSEDIDCEGEVNFEALKTEGVQVIHVEDKDDVSHGNGIAVLAEYLDEGGDISQQQEFFGTLTTQGADDIYDETTQTRRVGPSKADDVKPGTGQMHEGVVGQATSASVGRVKVEIGNEEDEVVIMADSTASETPVDVSQKQSDSIILSSQQQQQQHSLAPTILSRVPRILDRHHRSRVMYGGGGAVTANQFVARTSSVCNYCKIQVPKSEIREHLVAHMRGTVELSESRAVCPICGKSFKNKNSYKVHKSIYHRSVRSSHNTSSANSSTASSSSSYPPAASTGSSWTSYESFEF